MQALTAQEQALLSLGHSDRLVRRATAAAGRRILRLAVVHLAAPSFRLGTDGHRGFAGLAVLVRHPEALSSTFEAPGKRPRERPDARAGGGGVSGAGREASELHAEGRFAPPQSPVAGNQAFNACARLQEKSFQARAHVLSNAPPLADCNQDGDFNAPLRHDLRALSMAASRSSPKRARCVL